MNKITGQKGGGGSSRTPIEQPDDLQSTAKAKLLLALGEGEFAGELNGTNIFLDGTPLLNPDGSKNFSGVSWEFRAGTQAQTYIQGMPSAENEINVGTAVSSNTAWVHTFTNSQLSAIRVRLKFPSLFRQEDNGDLVGNEVKYAIDLQTDGGSWKTVVDSAVKGKTTSGYERTHRIDLPQSATLWTLRVRKITVDANSAKIGDTVVLQSYTEVIDAKFTYPHTALLYIEFDAKQFNGSTPQISCEPKMRIIRVPDNYDPESRTYSGVWSGQFKWAWTNNPAWVFYDIVISDRFGLGDRIKIQNIDKWELYRVAQYCDQPVPDGKGGSGTEPRYVCDVYVQDRNEAYTVLRDFAAIFRGMTYWGGNQIITLADMPRDIDYSYTRANVIDGEFAYSGSSSKTRYSSALVSYSDPANGYADAMEPVFESELVERFGFNQLEVTAIGCTRQSEANRKGRWGILTNNKDRIVTFSVGLDGNIPQPGYVIAVADEMLSGKVTGGRVSAVDGRSITLDRKPDAAPGDQLMLNLPSGKSQVRTIQMVTDSIVTVTTAYSETPEPECVWVVESDELYTQQYRVVSVTENDDGTFTISAAMHDPNKYDRIDTGAVLDERPISVIPPGNQFPPKEIIIDSYSVVHQGISVETMRVQWQPADNAIAYEAQWRRDNGNWISVPRSSTTSFEVPNIYAGRYQARVRAINAAEISSIWANAPETHLKGKEGNPPTPLGFRTTPIIFGIQLDWGFAAQTDDTLKTEIQYSRTNDGEGLMLLADIPYPQRTHTMQGLAAGVAFWFRARLVDKSGNQSPWTAFVRGESSDDASWIIDAAGDQFFSAQAGKRLQSDMNWSNETALILADAQQQLSRELMVRDGENKAQISELWQVRATDNEAWAQKLTELRTNIGNTDDSVNRIAADVIDNKQAVSNTQKAVAESTQQFQAQFREQQAIIREKATAVFDIDGNGYAIKDIGAGVNYRGQYYGAGMVIGAEVKNGRVETHFGVRANQLTVVNPTNGKMEPVFVIKNGQVFIRDTFIEDGSITNAKIGNFIQSRNYVAGRTGWKIDKSGFAEFGHIKARGEINATSGSLRNVTIEEDCEIKGTLSVNNIVGDIVKVYTMNPGNLTIPPSPFDRVIVIPALQITASSSKQAWVALNGNTICRARTYAISTGGLRTEYVPSIITGYGTLPKNVQGEITYYQEGASFMITILAFKA
ncbi:phage tail tip fiber protein [Xenorhabdus griffiniae]|uniref:DUF1983 domain-containing protein n=1 Tax=Xenorhabdus griffiniae TaxID=351672 RepID=A0ABY9XDG6_9GAMM|nr:DUF1983 domain-containing protein [Xenorhabdus griffiniae]MBE8588901.1 DUF1983 domain-containing protein [Xenorhabdus griffiniae]WMV70950.1 DUF1983 domain-containing protein [Xenorhabdus griffiniae]WNH00626.1 DUF1983 domain-containing protein [Xenorhabdus griffiniae]